jgi:hypothetical protein
MIKAAARGIDPRLAGNLVHAVLSVSLMIGVAVFLTAGGLLVGYM